MSGQEALTLFLNISVGHQCLVVLSTGSEFKGTLCTIDGLFNLVLKDAVEYREKQEINQFKSVFIRGTNVVHLTPITA